MVYVVALAVTVGDPLNTPVLVFKVNPDGSEGLIENNVAILLHDGVKFTD
jgi:hypothetical protein